MQPLLPVPVHVLGNSFLVELVVTHDRPEANMLKMLFETTNRIHPRTRLKSTAQLASLKRGPLR